MFDSNLLAVVGVITVLTLAAYLLAPSETFIGAPSIYGQGHYFTSHLPGPAWGNSPRSGGT